ncbi:MAG TPA: sulfite exporter TauE/SafE family protein [Kofleriaceae bacterium]|nr:sulfite exporter TauE/SafE family protein [Kofleriaceae bacterium]
MVDAPSLVLVGGAALAAGIVNAIAGGGSLITFPALVAIGLPAVTASVINTVAMCPGYFGATVAQRRDLVGQRRRAIQVLPAAAAGGVAGALLLLHTGEAAFTKVVPWLILLAVALLAFQDRLRRWLLGRSSKPHGEIWAALPVGLSAVYGGYFGAGMGVMVLAALAVVLDDSLIRVNALKQSVSLVVNVAAAIVFVVIAPIDWTVVIAMAVCALAGGSIGGAIASRVPAAVLKWTVVTVGLALAGVYFVKW